ncbi:MAG TPA: hypothetical protein VGX70_21780 [Gemmataceae bacterium]|jgi:hypothetical protein|nr:hypothetical protein [Gemmataceae bacterium]
MKIWTKCLSIVAITGMSASVWAQVPSGADPVSTAPPAAPAAAPAAGGGTIWNFFGINKAGLKECKIKLCKSNIGILLGNTMKPMSAMSGGLLPSCCPKVLNEDALNKAAKEGPEAAKGDAQAAAAKIAKDEAEAKERRAAVRYLGTVDCHYWGSVAEPALQAALRSDRNECVRWEAAMALGNGCCCTKKTIASLTISVYGVEKEGLTVAGTFADGNPVETSERVKGAALAALQHCLSCYTETVQPGPEKPERGPEKTDKPVAQGPVAQGAVTFQPAVYQKPVQARTMAQVVQDARQVTMTPTTVNVPLPREQRVKGEGSSRTLSGVFSRAFGPNPPAPGEPPTETAVIPSAPPPRYSGLLPWLTR